MRSAAGRSFADVVIGVPPGEAVGRAHAAADAVEDAIERAVPGADVVVHVEPRDDDDTDIAERVLAAASRALTGPGAAADEVAWTTALRPVWLAAAALVVLMAGNAVLQARLPPPVDLSPLFGSGEEVLMNGAATAPASRDRQRRVVALILLEAGAQERPDPAGGGMSWRQGSDSRPAPAGAAVHTKGVHR